MNNTTTRYWKKKSLNQYVHDQDGSLTLYSLFALGVIAALMHQHLRLGLNIPGHHGLEWFTLLLFGRMQSKYHGAGMVIACGAASTYLAQAATLPLAHTVKPALVYLLNGVCLDFLFRITPSGLPLIIKGMILGGISFMIKPLVLLPVAIAFEISFGSFSKHGYLFPLITHFAFGSIGAVCGITLANLLTGRHSNTSSDA